MKKLQPLITVFLASVVFVCSAQRAKLDRELSHLPPVVRKAILGEVSEGKLDSIEKNTEDSGVVYDVEMVLRGKMRGFTVDGNGAIIGKEVFLEELPAAVQQTILKHTGSGLLDQIERSVEEGELSYAVDITLNGKTRSFTVDGNGELVDEEVFLSELPTAVQQTISKQITNASLGEIDKVVEPAETTYRAEMTRGGKTRHFTVNATGSLKDTEVYLSELPAALQTAIQKQAGEDKVGEIDKNLEEELSYNVEVSGKTRSRTLTFDPDGKLLSTEEDVKLAEAPEAVQKAIKSLSENGKVLDISKTTETNALSYDVELETGGAHKSVSLDPEGKVIPEEESK